MLRVTLVAAAAATTCPPAARLFAPHHPRMAPSPAADERACGPGCCWYSEGVHALPKQASAEWRCDGASKAKEVIQRLGWLTFREHDDDAGAGAEGEASSPALRLETDVDLIDLFGDNCPQRRKTLTVSVHGDMDAANATVATAPPEHAFAEHELVVALPRCYCAASAAQ